MSLLLPPDCVRWINRNGEDNDCAVAAISLATGESYEQVLGTAMQVDPKALKTGMSMRKILVVLGLLGFAARLKRKFDIDEETGILIVAELKNTYERHAVYLWEGRIVEPSLGRRTLWKDPEQYLTDEKSKAFWLIVLDGKKEDK